MSPETVELGEVATAYRPVVQDPTASLLVVGTLAANFGPQDGGGTTPHQALVGGDYVACKGNGNRLKMLCNGPTLRGGLHK